MSWCWRVERAQAESGRLRELLAEGWEPFGVYPIQGPSGIETWFALRLYALVSA